MILTVFARETYGEGLKENLEDDDDGVGAKIGGVGAGDD
jgi:hypothetical protein